MKTSTKSGREQIRKTEPIFYHLSTGEVIEKPEHSFELLPNTTDCSHNFIVIEFYLPKPATAKLILMDSEENECMYLLNKNLKAGKHIFQSDIRNAELLSYKYYYKLDAYGYQEVKQMHYCW